MKVLLVDSSAHAPMNPLFINSLYAMEADRLLEAIVVDDAGFFQPRAKSRYASLCHRVTKRRPGFHSFNAALLDAASRNRPDVVLVVKGESVAPRTLEQIRALGSQLVCFATDDPFATTRSTSRWVRESIDNYDLYCSTKTAIIPDLERAGARRTTFVPFAFKPELHYFEQPNPIDRDCLAAEVLFIGGIDDDRAPFFRALLRAFPNLNLKVFGGGWNGYPEFKSYYGGNAVGRDFRLAISSAAIVLNLLRRSNRDGHVMRTFEVPACGGFLLTERSHEQARWFEEGSEMACFDSHEELISQVHRYLNDRDAASRIASAGHARVIAENHTYRDRLESILQLALG